MAPRGSSNFLNNYGSTEENSTNSSSPGISPDNSWSVGGGGSGYQLVPPADHTSKDDKDKLSLFYEDAEARSRRRRFWNIAKFVLITGLAIAVYCMYPYHSESEEPGNNSSNSGPTTPPLPVLGKRQPLSSLHPSKDLGLPTFKRPKDSRPSQVLTNNNKKNAKNKQPLFFPTNAWYQNMLLTSAGGPTKINRAYSTPFVVDAVGPVPGLRIHPNTVAASKSVIQLNVVEEYGLTIGAAPDALAAAMKKNKHNNTTTSSSQEEENNSTNTTTATTTATPAYNFSKEYTVDHMTPLGLTVAWHWEKSFPMTSSIVKGMPYGTMVYDEMMQHHAKESTEQQQEEEEEEEIWFPTVASEIPLAKAPVVDGGKTVLICHGGKPTAAAGGGNNNTSTTTTTINSTTATATLDVANSSNTSTSSSSSANNTTRRMMVVEEEEEEHHHHSVAASTVLVEREIELTFHDSDFTWLVFVSKPVMMQCVVDPNTNGIHLQVVKEADAEEEEEEQEIIPEVEGYAINSTTTSTTTEKAKASASPFVMRIAVSKVCTSNKNPIYCHHEQMMPDSLGLGQGRYDDLLRNHSHLVPGPDTGFDYEVDDAQQQINIEFDWDVRDMTRNYNEKTPTLVNKTDLIVFALPHHLDLMGTGNAPGYLKYCAATLIGPACLLSGSKWNMVDSVPHIDFRAPRPPAPWAIKDIAKSALKDIQYRLPKTYQKGAGDTYFSGKMLAKLGRILTIVEELQYLCGKKMGSSVAKGYEQACQGTKLPTDRAVKRAVDSLRSSVEIWLNGKAITPFVYDEEWGGVVSCGCNNPDGGLCQNKFPDCPAFTDPGLNFGNAFYNDLHFHYGYHIFAAAVVSHFDPDWGKEFFERVLLLVRNIANPADSGDYFQAFRHKDWYQGHSWASGVVPPYLNGRNQESSSESIAAYESVALYGAIMTSVFEKDSWNAESARRAKEVRKAGQILTATELRSTRRYYHVRDEKNANEALKIYPREYNNHAIGMMWNTMAQYQTWFGGKPYLAAGIQLLPITPIAEERDGLQWLSEMYPSFASTCADNKECEENGWSVLQIASLASIGYHKNATNEALDLPASVFTSAGGNGHSLTNTLWYIASRPVVKEPVDIKKATEDEPAGDATTGAGNSTSGNSTKPTHEDHTTSIHQVTDCYQPQVCTDYVLDTIADEYSCRQRMTDLINTMGHTQEEACFMVAKIQFPEQCGACNPNATASAKVYVPQCPPCTVRQCESDLNKCPQFSQTFVCTNGPNRGGCSRFPWDIRSEQCFGCCELSECMRKHAL